MNRTVLVAASLEHVVRIARDVGALPEELGTLVDLVLHAAWSGRTDLTTAAQADDLGDTFSDELCTDRASLARAAAHLARGDVDGPQALNLVDDCIDQVDPEGELGVEEETAWRAEVEKLLLGSQEPVSRADLEALLSVIPTWAVRWREDWDR